MTRWHYDTAVPALLTPMAIFSGHWAEGLYDAVAAAEEGMMSRSSPIAFTFMALLVGHFVLVNLFVAVLVERFVQDESTRRREAASKPGAGKSRNVLATWQERAKAITKKVLEIAHTSPSFKQRAASAMGDEEEMDEASERPAQTDSDVTCGCLRPESPLRLMSAAILSNPMWDMLVLSLILISCLCLAYDSPQLDPESTLAGDLAVANIVVTLLFALEASLKIILYGFVMGDGAYLRSSWNQLDFFILLTSLPTLLPGSGGGSAVVRLLRVLRPLRLVSHVPGMSVIFRFLLESIVDLANVLGVNLFFVLVGGPPSTRGSADTPTALLTSALAFALPPVLAFV